ncbi:MAG: FAD-binding protein [Magnetococcales bacterium]|nr:FAD-binding protein [Magnetococcales bacterium]
MIELEPDVLQTLSRILGGERLLTARADLEAYAWDNTGPKYLPQAVALAETREEVAAVLSTCQRARIPVVPRGAGTGNVGGSLPVRGGIVLSTQRMNRILEIQPADRLAVVEPGVINADLQQALAPTGLFWPPDPSSAKSCSVGGNLAMCAAGPNAPRFGVTRDWVLGLTAVLMDGSLLRTGGRTTKGVVGYDLTRLLVGSEGTLAVIVEATLKLAPRPAERRLLRACFASVEEAARAVTRLMGEGESPSAVEFIDAGCLDLLRQANASTLPEAARALLLVEVSGESGMATWQAERVLERLQALNPLETATAGVEEAGRIWSARFALSPLLKKLAPRRINEDVVVPVSHLAELVTGVEEIAARRGIPIVCFGHAGNGNLHVNLLVDPADAKQMSRVDPALGDLFRLTLALQGSLSGEHGVGLQKSPFIAWELDPVSLALQQRLKALFDPLGLLNPGKIFPADSPRLV